MSAPSDVAAAAGLGQSADGAAVIYFDGLARRLGKTPGAVRAMFYRGRPGCLPPHVRVGGRPAWVVEDVDRWLASLPRVTT